MGHSTARQETETIPRRRSGRQKDSSQTTIQQETKITQTVSANQGTVIGAIHYNIPDIEAPPHDEIVEYLNRLIKDRSKQLAGKSDSAKMQRLWEMPFYVSPQGLATRLLLNEALTRNFELKDSAEVIQSAVALLGDSGVGKTPGVLKYMIEVAHDCLLQRSSSEDDTPVTSRIPIWLSINELKPGQQLLSLVRTSFNRYAVRGINQDEADKLLKDHRCLLILADVDNPMSDARQTIVRSVMEFINNYPKSFFLITCRTSSYYNQFGPIDTFELEELTEQQVREVMGSRFPEQLMSIAQNRAMLKILIEEEEENAGAIEHWTHGKLLGRLVLDKIEEDQSLDLEVEMIEQLLEELAYQMHENHAYGYTDHQLMECLTAFLARWHEPYSWRQLAQKVQKTGILLKDKQQRLWRFDDRTHQAYFVAAAIFRNESLLPHLLDRIDDYWWAEPLQILVGLLDEPSDLLFDLIDRDVKVAARCLRFAGPNVNDRVINALIDALIEDMQYERADGREQLVTVLSETGYPPKELLLHMLYSERKSPVIRTIAQALTLEYKRPKYKYTYDFHGQFKPTSIDPQIVQIIEIWKKDTQFSDDEFNYLVDLLRNQQDVQDGLISGVAAIALGFIAKATSSKQAIEVLMQELRNAANTFVAWCVLEALGQIKYSDVEEYAIELYYDVMQEQRNSPIFGDKALRIYAIYLLGATGGQLQDSIDIIDKALDSQNDDVRAYSATALGEIGWPDCNERLEERLLLTGKESEKNLWVLRRVIDALGKVGTLDSVEVLAPYLRHENKRTRKRTREAIANIKRRFEMI